MKFVSKFIIYLEVYKFVYLKILFVSGQQYVYVHSIVPYTSRTFLINRPTRNEIRSRNVYVAEIYGTAGPQVQSRLAR